MESGFPPRRLRTAAAFIAIGVAVAAAYYFFRLPRQPTREAVVIALPMHLTSQLAHVALERGFFCRPRPRCHGAGVPQRQTGAGGGPPRGAADITWANETPVALAGLGHKRVNDTYGHKAGDLVRQALGRQLQGHSRVGDIACRYGGEEFLMVLPHASAEFASQRAEEWRTAFEASRVRCGDEEIGATLSLGVATYPTHGGAGGAVIAKADEALYLAKGGGRNRVVLAT